MKFSAPYEHWTPLCPASNYFVTRPASASSEILVQKEQINKVLFSTCSLYFCIGELWAGHSGCLCRAWLLRRWAAAALLSVCILISCVAVAAQLLPANCIHDTCLWQLSVNTMTWFSITPTERARKQKWEREGKKESKCFLQITEQIKPSLLLSVQWHPSILWPHLSIHPISLLNWNDLTSVHFWWNKPKPKEGSFGLVFFHQSLTL